ncbi:hypothetical protein KCU99_g260, partial [Aureobasidium melanogenum]
MQLDASIAEDQFLLLLLQTRRSVAACSRSHSVLSVNDEVVPDRSHRLVIGGHCLSRSAGWSAILTPDLDFRQLVVASLDSSPTQTQLRTKQRSFSHSAEKDEKKLFSSFVFVAS